MNILSGYTLISPIDWRYRPYNSVRTNVVHCEKPPKIANCWTETVTINKTHLESAPLITNRPLIAISNMTYKPIKLNHTNLVFGLWSEFIGRSAVTAGLHPSGVAKSSTSFGWGKGGKVISAGWQVTLCDLIWHVISRSGVIISITNCYIRFTLLYFYFYESPCLVVMICPTLVNTVRHTENFWTVILLAQPAKLTRQQFPQS